MIWYNGPVIDAHHHFWEPRDGNQPWLTPGAAIDFRYGDYSALKRDYLPADLRADAVQADINLAGSISMETEWKVDDPIGEMHYTAQLAAADDLPTAAVAHAVLRDPEVGNVLEELSQISLVKGIRNKPGPAAGRDATAFTSSLLTDRTWREGFGLLERYGLSFDLQVGWRNLSEAVPLLEAHPDIQVIINHAGLPADRSQQALRAWAASLRAVARFPQVSVKCSGIGVPGRKWTAELNRPIIEVLIDTFEPARVMFASNFPVDSLVGSYKEIWDSFREVAQQYSRWEQAMMFGGTATRVYRLPADLMNEETNSS